MHDSNGQGHENSRLDSEITRMTNILVSLGWCYLGEGVWRTADDRDVCTAEAFLYAKAQG